MPFHLSQVFLQHKKRRWLLLQPNYRQAAKYSPKNLGKLVHSTTVRPNWLENGKSLWYQYKTTEGSSYYIVDADTRTKAKLFDNAKMAKGYRRLPKTPMKQSISTIRFRICR